MSHITLANMKTYKMWILSKTILQIIIFLKQDQKNKPKEKPCLVSKHFLKEHEFNTAW